MLGLSEIGDTKMGRLQDLKDKIRKSTDTAKLRLKEREEAKEKKAEAKLKQLQAKKKTLAGKQRKKTERAKLNAEIKALNREVTLSGRIQAAVENELRKEYNRQKKKRSK